MANHLELSKGSHTTMVYIATPHVKLRPALDHFTQKRWSFRGAKHITGQDRVIERID